MSIRQSTINDYREVDRLLLKLHKLDCIGSPLSPLKRNPSSILSPDQYALILADKVSKIFVALVGGRIVGVIYLFVEESEESSETISRRQPVIGSLFVLHKYRRQGVASKLVARAERWAKNFDGELSTITYAYNHAAQDFFERRGFGQRSIRLNKDISSNRQFRGGF